MIERILKTEFTLMFSVDFQGTQFCFTQFMFVFDVKAKARILETDAHLKMMVKIHSFCFTVTPSYLGLIY